MTSQSVTAEYVFDVSVSHPGAKHFRKKLTLKHSPHHCAKSGQVHFFAPHLIILKDIVRRPFSYVPLEKAHGTDRIGPQNVAEGEITSTSKITS